MPRAEILSKQAVYTLGLLHAELAGKLLANKREAIRLPTAMLQVAAVMKMLNPAVNISADRVEKQSCRQPVFQARDAL